MKSLLRETFGVYWRQPKLSESGKPVYSNNPVMIKGRLQHTDKIIEVPNGENIKVDAILFTMPNPVIKLNCKIKPEGGEEYQVISIKKPKDETGVHHFESALRLLKYAKV